MEHATPNLFILGAAKCGTTSLHEILGQHPEVHANSMKEPTFFNWPFQLVRSPIAYFKLFENSRRYRLDSSTAYLANPETAPILRQLFPTARFIVTLREPKARAYSLYCNNRFHGWESIDTFSAALKAESHRYTSVDFMQTCAWDFWTYLYCRSSLYDEQVERYFRLFQREQFHIVTLAELYGNPLGTTEEILRFLDLDPAPARRIDFSIRNRRDNREPPYDEECSAFLTEAFSGVTERTERLVGRSLDWSM